MATSIQARGNAHQLRVTHKLLPRPMFRTFDSQAEASTYGAQLVQLLDRGIVPAELLAPQAKGSRPDPLLVQAIRAYSQAAPITDSDADLFRSMLDELVGVRVSGVTFGWAQAYVGKLKARKLAPGTIRKRVGALARVLDWHLLSTTPAGEVPLANVLRLLPTGYSAYSRAEAVQLGIELDATPRDSARDRRLASGELQRIEAALAGVKREDRERALEVDPALDLLFHLILDTGLRLREAYRLRVDQLELGRGFIRVEGSKGHRGAIKPRTVPLRPAMVDKRRERTRDRVGLVFPYWDGTPAGLKKTTAKLSARFAVLFDYAKVPGLTEHDLRHEATCRWVELKRPDGAWTFSELEVCKLMGWSSTDMMLRYASLRGEDLAARLG
jgi:integrase